ncbi:MAG TPA: hypothetical protein VIP75_02285 [Acidothermales bacterium]
MGLSSGLLQGEWLAERVDEQIGVVLVRHGCAVQSGHQRSKLERDGDTLFVVPSPARDLDDVEQVEFGVLM